VVIFIYLLITQRRETVYVAVSIDKQLLFVSVQKVVYQFMPRRKFKVEMLMCFLECSPASYVCLCVCMSALIQSVQFSCSMLYPVKFVDRSVV